MNDNETINLLNRVNSKAMIRWIAGYSGLAWLKGFWFSSQVSSLQFFVILVWPRGRQFRCKCTDLRSSPFGHFLRMKRVQRRAGIFPFSPFPTCSTTLLQSSVFVPNAPCINNVSPPFLRSSYTIPPGSKGPWAVRFR